MDGRNCIETTQTKANELTNDQTKPSRGRRITRVHFGPGMRCWRCVASFLAGGGPFPTKHQAMAESIASTSLLLKAAEQQKKKEEKKPF